METRAFLFTQFYEGFQNWSKKLFWQPHQTTFDDILGGQAERCDTTFVWSIKFFTYNLFYEISIKQGEENNLIIEFKSLEWKRKLFWKALKFFLQWAWSLFGRLQKFHNIIFFPLSFYVHSLMEMLKLWDLLMSWKKNRNWLGRQNN